VDPLESRKFGFAKDWTVNDYLKYAASETQDDYAKNYGMLRQSAGELGAQGGPVDSALGSKINEMRNQRLGQIDSSRDRNQIFNYSDRLTQTQGVLNQKLAQDAEAARLKAARKATKEGKRRGFASAALGTVGAIAGGALAGSVSGGMGAGAGAAIGGGIGVAVGSMV
jgi:hypothetical protein